MGVGVHYLASTGRFALLGVIGLIFATPLTACAIVLVQRIYVEDTLGDRLERPVKT